MFHYHSLYEGLILLVSDVSHVFSSYHSLYEGLIRVVTYSALLFIPNSTIPYMSA